MVLRIKMFRYCLNTAVIAVAVLFLPTWNFCYCTKPTHPSISEICIRVLSTVVPNHQAFLDSWAAAGYKVEFHHPEKPLKVIFIGEEHYTKDFIQKQIELIRAVRPEFVLHEFAGAMQYNPSTGKWEKMKGRKFGRFEEYGNPPKEIIALAKELGIKIIGNDLTDAELNAAGKDFAERHPDQYTWDRRFQCWRKREILTLFSQLSPMKLFLTATGIWLK